MIGKEELEEIERRANDWARAYNVIDEKNKELCALDIRRSKLVDEISQEEKIKSSSQDVINTLISEYEDEDSERKIKSIVDKYITPIVTRGMIQ